VNIREARREDDAALRALEARTPLNIGDQHIFTPHQSFFETHDMQSRTVVMLAEEDGEIIATCAGALNRAPLAGAERLLLYTHHARIAPEHQRKGIGGALTSAISAYWKEHEPAHIDSSYWYIAAGNAQSRSFAERGGNKPWPLSVYLCSIQADPGPAAPAKRIGAGPTFDIVRLINATHKGEELFRPYEHVDFGQRLSRSADYGWGDIFGRFDGGRLVAVAGLWKQTVSDYGYEAAAEADMAALLQDLAALRGDLTILLDGRSPLLPALGLDRSRQFELLFYAPRIETPANPGVIYVDPVYF
jgi:GNAT superfamily N-acetyltransferase